MLSDDGRPIHWTGGPTREFAAIIHSLTRSGTPGIDPPDGKLFFRLGVSAPWQRLRTAADYALLNQILDAYRPQPAARTMTLGEDAYETVAQTGTIRGDR